MPDLQVVAEIRWQWAPWLPAKRAAMYRAHPSRVGVNPHWWGRHVDEQRRELAIHEVGHHRLALSYPLGRTRKEERNFIEAKAERAGKKWWVSEEEVQRAYRAGCREIWEYAVRWGVTHEWARRRLELFRARTPRPPNDATGDSDG